MYNKTKKVWYTARVRISETINANMLGAYYTTGYHSSELFKNLKLSQINNYDDYMNKHHVIYIDFSRLPDPCKSFTDYIDWVKFCILQDIKEMFGLSLLQGEPIQELLKKTGESFIFILDEWDSIFYEKFMTENDKHNYLKFLKGLLKDQPYVDLAYMTGVLPIAKYSSGSELNMFKEYNFMNDSTYENFFGFGEDEVQALCEQFPTIAYESLKYWYDGYHKKDDSSIFNPRSVSFALTDGVCRNYWTETGPMNEIADCIENNVDAVREDIVKLVSGIAVEVELEGYGVSDLNLNSRDEILSAMVVYGFLSYHAGVLRIPNHELMLKFQNTLKRESMGEVAEIIQHSKSILDATIHQDADAVSNYLEEIQANGPAACDREIPFLQYNDENSLSCVITLCYLKARDYYEVTREDKSGKGYVDFLFKPLRKGYPAIVLELKYDKSAEAAINQIRRKNYIDRVRKYDEILLVGINYTNEDTTTSSTNKKHTCIIEKIIK